MEEKIAREIEIINRILGCIKYWFGLPPVGEPERRPGRCISWWFEIWIDVASVAIINLGKGTERAWWLDYTEKTKRIKKKKKKSFIIPHIHFRFYIMNKKYTQGNELLLLTRLSNNIQMQLKSLVFPSIPALLPCGSIGTGRGIREGSTWGGRSHFSGSVRNLNYLGGLLILTW